MLPIPGTLVIWAVALFFHKGTAHIPIFDYANKPVSSLSVGLGELQSKSTMLSGEKW